MSSDPRSYSYSPKYNRWARAAPLYDDWVYSTGYREVSPGPRPLADPRASPSRSLVTYQGPTYHGPPTYTYHDAPHYYEPHPYPVRYIDDAPQYVYASPPRRMVYRTIPAPPPPPPPPVVVAPPPPPPPPPAPAPIPVHAVLGLDVKYKSDGLGGSDNVVVVHNLVESGPGHKAGLSHEDVISAWNGHPINGRKHWIDAVRTAKPGTPVKLSVYRHGVLRECTMTPDAWKQPRHGSYRITSTRLSPSKSPSRSPSRRYEA